MTIEQETIAGEPSGAGGAPRLAPGRIVGGRYRLEELLGRGGMGEVWRASDLTLRTEVALKCATVPSARARERLRSEVLAARKVVSPNVCRVFDLLEAGGHAFVSMELVEGRPLRDLIHDDGPLPLRRAHDIAAQLLAGLEQIHRAGLVHRDLKPANVMITRSGRVVIMDFGLACAADESASAAGTRPYMAPEQALGERVGPRADLYAAGIILAEMTAPHGMREPAAQKKLWRDVRADPPRLPDTPWAPVLRSALRARISDRCASAGEFLRMLQDVGRRIEGADHLEPYPGLAAFTEADAPWFFGREREIEQIWRRLATPHLQAVIGPSGGGKSSFVRAGLAASAPPGWRIVIATPGTRPFGNLARALAAELGGDTAAMDDLLRFDEPDVAAGLIARWRTRHDQALLVVDQFEELFVQNPPEVQARFADLLGRLPLQAKTHVLVSMRDDFFFRCNAHEALAPVFSEPFPLEAPSGAALRRALVEPALACGYRFEDETLVDEIVGGVAGERGALPLIAFAVARLWACRDRERGVLTREAYREIGGVSGALARHAEATLERIGRDRDPIVREIFRNLATAQRTRVARDRAELLSVFSERDRAAAEDVLEALIVARLLTAFDSEGATRVEVVHDSLLTHWPRLERWQMRDAAGAQLRDELRQAAQVWEQHGRADDFLWTGTAYREYQLWRERDRRGLTTLEEAFVRAMTRLAESRRRRRRLALVTASLMVAAVAVGLTILWQRSVREARRATAAELLALGRAVLETDRMAALAYAIESLRLADTAGARRFALEVLWRGPLEVVTPLHPGEGTSYRFSPDGAWLGIGQAEGGVTVLPREGGPPVNPTKFDSYGLIAFSDDGSAALGHSPNATKVRLWSVPGWRPARTIELSRDEGMTVAGFGGTPDEVITLRIPQAATWGGSDEGRLQRWPASSDPIDLGTLRTNTIPTLRAGENRIAAGYGTELRLYALDDVEGAFTIAGRHTKRFQWNASPAIGREGEFAVGVDSGGEIVLWSLQRPGERLRTLAGISGVEPLAARLSADGARLCVSWDREVRIWDLAGVAAAEPVRIPIARAPFTTCDVAPGGDWVATRHVRHIEWSEKFRSSLWRLTEKRVRVLRGHEGGAESVAFSPDGRYLYSIGKHDGRVVRWPLAAKPGEKETVVFQRSPVLFSGFTPDRLNRFLLATRADGLWRIPFDGGQPELLTELAVITGAVDPQGRLLAVAPAGAKRIRVRNLESGEWREIGEPGNVGFLDFDARGRLLFSHDGDVRIWNPETDRISLLARKRPASDADPGGPLWFVRSLADGRRALVGGDRIRIVDVDTGSEVPVRRPLVGGSSAMIRIDAGIAVDAVDDRSIRVGPLEDARVWTLAGQEGTLYDVAVSPDARWVAAGTSEAVYLWPMPDFARPPLAEFAADDLIAKLESLTNVRIVADPAQPNGYRVRIDDTRYRGWAEEPEW